MPMFANMSLGTTMFLVFIAEIVFITPSAAEDCLETDLPEGMQMLQRKGERKRQMEPPFKELLDEDIHVYYKLSATTDSDASFMETVHRDWRTGSNCSSMQSSTGLGATAAITEDGYLSVANLCCNYEMEIYIRRVIAEMGLKICIEGGFMGFVPWYTCEEKTIRNLAIMKEELNWYAQSINTKGCGWCTEDAKACKTIEELPDICVKGSNPNPAYHRRRACKTATTTEAPTPAPTTTEAPTPPPTTTEAPTPPPTTTEAPTAPPTTTEAPTPPPTTTEAPTPPPTTTEAPTPPPTTTEAPTPPPTTTEAPTPPPTTTEAPTPAPTTPTTTAVTAPPTAAPTPPPTTTEAATTTVAATTVATTTAAATSKAPDTTTPVPSEWPKTSLMPTLPPPEDNFTAEPYHFGCFKDYGANHLLNPERCPGMICEGRDLPKRAADTTEPAQCAKNCKGYRYFGLQFGYECWCGQKYGAYGEACDCKCEPGNWTGGFWRMCVFGTAAAPTTCTTTTAPPYLGCFKDDWVRDLHVKVGKPGDATPGLCRLQCAAKNYTYSAIQANVECWCGNSYGKHGEACDCDCENPKWKGKGFRNCMYGEPKKHTSKCKGSL